MNYRAGLLSVAGALMLCAVVVLTASAGPLPLPRPTPRALPALTITAAPGNGITSFSPLSLTRAQLAALPQQTATVTIGGVSTTESGPSLSSLLSQAGLQYISACKNDDLRYWVEATSGSGAAVEIAAGELDPSFGNNPAILSISENGKPLSSPRLVVPGDATDARDIQDVTQITVGRAAPQLASSTAACNPASFTAPVTAPPDGTVTINGDVAHPLSLTWSQLEALPQVTQTDTFKNGSTAKTYTEVGPTLFSVLAAAEPRFHFRDPGDDLRFYVEVTSSEDGSAVLVSWAEIDPAYNGNQVLLSLSQDGTPFLGDSSGDTDPRLTVPGDVQGGRYDYGAAVITVFRAPDIGPARGSGPFPPPHIGPLVHHGPPSPLRHG